jgi:hypothetical protein
MRQGEEIRVRIWKGQEDSVDTALRSAAPRAAEELVDELSGRVLASATRRSGRTSRTAFGAALTVFMLGTFASFGGLGYAATSAQSTVTAVKRVVVKEQKTKTAAAQTSAATQYGAQDVPTVKTPSDPVVRVAGTTATQPQQTGTLPFTGYGLGATAALGTALLALGLLLRRREQLE